MALYPSEEAMSSTQGPGPACADLPASRGIPSPPFLSVTQLTLAVRWYTSINCVFLPPVIYKTSLLHLQPRQMTIYLPEVRKISMDYINLPVFNPNVFSEDEDDLPGVSHP